MHTHTHTHTHRVIMATSSSLNTHTSTSARTQSHWLSSLGKEMGFQRRSERLNGVLLLDALVEDIPEGGSDISEGLLAILLCLGIPGPGNIKERSRCWSEKARRVVFLEKIREVEGGVIMNWLISGRENFVADPFLDGKPMKLPKNGSDVICFKTQTDIIKRNCHSYKCWSQPNWKSHVDIFGFHFSCVYMSYQS